MGGDALGELGIDLGEVGHHPFVDAGAQALGELEAERPGDVVLFDRGQRPVEEGRLAEVVVEARGADLHLRSVHLTGDVGVAAVPDRRERAAPAERVRGVGGDALVDRLLHDPVPVVVVDGGDRPVDGDLREVRPTEPRQLGVEVREEPSVQQRIVDDVDPGDEVSRVERDLFGLGEVVRRVAVEGHAPDDANGAELLGHQLGRVEQIDAFEGLLLRVGHDLDAQLPLRRVAGGDPLVEVAPVEVGIDPAELLGLLPHQPVHPGDGLPVPLHQLVDPSRATRRNVWTPKPSIVANERGMARSDMTHISMWVVSGCSDAKSQNVS